MTLVDLLWAPPLILAISVCLGTAGRSAPHDIRRHVRRTFIALTIGIAVVGIAIRAIVLSFV